MEHVVYASYTHTHNSLFERSQRLLTVTSHITNRINTDSSTKQIITTKYTVEFLGSQSIKQQRKDSEPESFRTTATNRVKYIIAH